MSRKNCLQCRRPAVLCICHAVHSIETRTVVTVVQHPGEHDHPFNTARLARMALNRLEVKLAPKCHLDRPELLAGAALLFPGEGACDLAAMPVHELPTHLVVLDGTWSQAAALHRENAWLRTLSQVQISPAGPSNYRIRKGPAPHCLSTIESIAAALAICEPENSGLSGLLDGFNALIEGQLAQRRIRGRC